MLRPQGRGWIVQNTPRERARPSSGDLCPRHALASDPLPPPPLLVTAGFKRANLPLSFSLPPHNDPFERGGSQELPLWLLLADSQLGGCLQSHTCLLHSWPAAARVH